MTKKMLIDAAHPEEVRVALLSQGKIEDFDFESAAKRPLRGNIFLARVTRVEPSLQAAFVDYGGNRHGFLAFSEIHPDYYQIPISDRQLLQEAEQEVVKLAAELELVQRGDEDDDDNGHDEDDDDGQDIAAVAEDEEVDEQPAAEATSSDSEAGDGDGEDTAESADLNDAEVSDAKASDAPSKDEEEEEEEDVKNDASDAANTSDNNAAKGAEEDDNSPAVAAAEDGEAEDSAEEDAEEDTVAEASGVEDGDAAEDAADTEDDSGENANAEDDDAEDDNAEGGAEAKSASASARKARAQLFERYKEAKRKRSNLLRNYKIQEVIKRRQILLIQVVKEERGNKGAALTTYMSLAGRYCVLMPNTARGGGISRKIAHASDRRRLRRIVDSLDVPQGMGLIIRTAGSKRTKVEIKRDYDYLLRLWENIRTLTLKSIAPCMVYEEANLIKRAIRDLYDKDISSVLIEGENGYREAKDFMKMLMPSHAKNVQPYKDAAPIFLRHGIEEQLDGMYQPTVRLKSGGYIVIHQTEALIAIDVNSGRSTRERNIEQTALKTNVEAAAEAARQFRLRDLAGLIVIDFIDMDEAKNNRKVEKALKEAMKTDRARVQVGRISPFGLLELSRQRRRSGIVDGTTQTCPTCAGAGAIRSNEIAALRILRAIEGEAISGKVGRITLRASLDVSLHILNHNRDWIKRIEDANGVAIEILADPDKAGDAHDLEKSGVPSERKTERTFISADQNEPVEVVEEVVEPIDDETEEKHDNNGRKRSRRRRGGRGRDTRQETAAPDEKTDDGDAGDDQSEKAARDGDDENDDGKRKKRRRGRRGGRRNRRSNGDGDQATPQEADAPQSDQDAAPSDADEQPAPASQQPEPADAPAATAPAEQAAPETVSADEDPAPKKRTRKRRVRKKAAASDDAAAPTSANQDGPPAEPVSKSAQSETPPSETVASSDTASNGAAKPSDAPQEAAPSAKEDTSESPAAPKKRSRKGWWQKAV
ncbi:MAG: Rne/Rng family ribonuclease [Alphaproteobacteria bacterium]|nr:Rne/Rng family ribonuclease [Alphaproteobacteria bacterium]